MTIGVSKERLLLVKEKLKSDTYYDQHDKDTLVNLLDALISYSDELNQWLPINENTPKDRCLWLSNGKDKCLAIWFRDRWRVIVKVNTDNHTNDNFTHYQELPDDPKDQ